jgi:hypothetical protein
MRTLKLFLGWNYGSHKNNGAVTIEASIVLPLFICVALSIAFFIKVVYTHEIIQHALNQTANEISQLSYIYHASGVKSIEEEIFQNIGNEVGELEDIPEELRDMLYSVIKGIYEDDFNRLCSTLTKIYMGKYFTDGEIKDPDKKLKKLNIDDGMNGLDMSMSSFFVDDKNDIDMIVRYKIDIPVPIKIFPPLHFVQRATVKAWLFGDEIINDNEEDIWSLDNFTRGRKIRKMFGANLPFNFPVIARFNSGTAVMIKSMDLTAKSYQMSEAVKKKVELYINELAGYPGQENPWGKDGIVIKREDIKVKQLLLVIPENPVVKEVMESLEECIIYARGVGVLLSIRKYGYKKDANAIGT